MRVTLLAACALALAGVLPAAGHEMAWQTGASRIKSVGHCAKGPCQRRASFEASAPDRNVDPVKCRGQSVSANRAASRVDCKVR